MNQYKHILRYFLLDLSFCSVQSRLFSPPLFFSVFTPHRATVAWFMNEQHLLLQLLHIFVSVTVTAIPSRCSSAQMILCFCYEFLLSHFISQTRTSLFFYCCCLCSVSCFSLSCAVTILQYQLQPDVIHLIQLHPLLPACATALSDETKVE